MTVKVNVSFDFRMQFVAMFILMKRGLTMTRMTTVWKLNVDTREHDIILPT